jgi:hypothetical protein
MARRNERQVTITFMLDPQSAHTQAAIIECLQAGTAWQSIGVRAIKSRAADHLRHHGLSAFELSDLGVDEPDDDTYEAMNKVLDRIFGWH